MASRFHLPRPARLPKRPVLSLALLLALGAGLGACGSGATGTGQEPPRRITAGHTCPGARSCPYRQVLMIGTRGEGVLRAPEAIAVAPGPAARVYVADQFGHSVQMFSAAGRFEGEWGSFGSAPGQFGAVGGLAVDSRGDVYLVDSSNNRVEKFTPGGAFITQWGRHGSGVGEFAFGGGRGPDMPPGGGIAVSGDHAYVADTKNNRIERFSLEGAAPRVIVGAGTAPGEVLSPRGLAAIGERLYVTDNGSDRVQELTSDGKFIAQASQFPATPEAFANPFDIAVHGERVYVVDDNNGRIVTLTRSLGYVGSFAGEGSLRLSKYPRAVATDQLGRVYVVDASHDRIVVFDAHGSPLLGWGRRGDGTRQFVAPLDVAAAPNGQVLVVQSFGSRSPMDLYSPQLRQLATWLRGGETILGRHWFSPVAAAFAPDGTLWVLDAANGLVRHLSGTGRFLGAISVSSSGSFGSASPVAGGTSEPSGVAVTAGGEVLIADTAQNRIEEFSPAGRLVGDLTRAGGVPFHTPLAVAVGPRDHVYVVDTGNHRVVELDRAGGLLASWGARGRRPGQFETPAGIAIDSRGHVFVSDMGSDRIQEFSAHGGLLRSWGAEGTGVGQLSGPRGMAVDCQGDLLVADTHNNRVQVFAAIASPPASCLRGVTAERPASSRGRSQAPRSGIG
jgi:DNA-binding beta-propeller fold protein YncE